MSAASAPKLCYLVPIDSSAPKIEIPHKKEVNIADGGDRLIFDNDLSEPQLIATADTKKCTLTVTLLADHNFSCNGFRLVRGVAYNLKEGATIHLHAKRKTYKVSFMTMAEKMEFETAAPRAQWEMIDERELLVYTPPNCAHSSLIAAFDLDATLIRTKSGSRFPKDNDDWELLFGNVKSKLKEIFEEDYKIVIFTNQGAIGKYEQKRNGFQKKIEDIVKRIDLPLQVFIATGHSIYRKPVPGMWFVMTLEKNGGVQVDLEKSFFVGDAAGRPKNWAHRKPKDHSLADRLFAANVGIKFYTPEEYFLGARPVAHNPPKFEPKQIATAPFTAPVSDQLEVIIMVGCPASGKSFFSEKHLVPKGYVRVNRDRLGSWQKCVKVMEQALTDQKKVVIDNTNPNRETRKRYIEAAKRLNVRCRCFKMKVDDAHAKHNNRFRELTDRMHEKVSDIIINSYYKHFEEPTLDEGFTEIVEVPFVPAFSNAKQEQLYRMYLLSAV